MSAVSFLFLHPRDACECKAIILYMTTISLAEARAQLSKLVGEAASTHAVFDITRNGRRDAVLLAAEDYDALLETLDILSDETEVAQLREAIAQQKAGKMRVVDKEELRQKIQSRIS